MRGLVGCTAQPGMNASVVSKGLEGILGGKSLGTLARVPRDTKGKQVREQRDRGTQYWHNSRVSQDWKTAQE